jgi:glycosyltransferase involved in cell wall biosynthesis
VLTPAYNEAKYLAQAIESVLDQTYTNWEYVIVDNCSQDATLEVARRFAQQDRRIRVLHNESLLSQAKNFNFTVQQISPASKYAKFVQGDDFIYPQCLEEMVKLAEENPNVGIVSSLRLDGEKVKGDGLPLPCRVISGREVCRKHFNEPIFLFGTPTTVMFRSEILRSRTPFFNEACLHFDTEACFEFLEKWDFGFIHQVLSFSRTDNISITSALLRFDPDAIDHLITLRKYGPKYLTPEEFAPKWREEEEIFYGLLARAVLNRKGPEYWRYQLDGLRVAGCELNRAKLWKHVGLILLNRFGNPVASFHNWRSRGKNVRRAGVPN